MVDRDDPRLKWPIKNKALFNQFMSDDELKNDRPSVAMCRLFYNTDINRIAREVL